MKPETRLAQAGSRRDPHTGAIAMPIHTSAAFQHPALGQSTGFDYSRSGNPTRQALEDIIATLEGGARASAFASGMAAIDAVLRLFLPGDRLIVTEDPYGGSYRLFQQLGRPYGIDFLYVDTSDTQAVEAALNEPGVKGIYVEVPTNPLLKVANLADIGALARKADVLFIVDNTFLTAYFCRPLDLGADITVYSATKYLGGHNDLIAGLTVSRSADVGDRLAFIQNSVGAILGPFECWLLLRSLKTLALRLDRHEKNALAVARFLNAHPGVSNLRYPGLPDDPGHKTLAAQSTGFGAMISFQVDHPGRVEKVLSQVQVFLFAESLGATESLVTFPAVQTHADVDADIRDRLGINDRLLRLSIGLEDPSDLIADLDRVLA